MYVNIYFFHLANSDQNDVESNNANVAISIARGSLEQGNVVELNCALNGIYTYYY